MFFCRIVILIIAILVGLSAGTTAQWTDLSKLMVTNTTEMFDTTVGPHGGKIVRRNQYVFETVYDADGIRVYVSDTAGRQLKPKGVSGICIFPRDSGGLHRLEFKLKRDRKKHTARFRSTKCKRGYYLFVPHDFSLVPDGTIQVHFELSELPGQTVPTIGYSSLFGMTRLQGWSCRGHENRIFVKYKDHPLCEKRYLDEAPFLYQCPKHPDSRCDRPSVCPLCSTDRVATRQSLEIFRTRREPRRFKMKK